MGRSGTIAALFGMVYRESGFDRGLLNFDAKASSLVSEGSRFCGDQTAEKAIVSGSSLIGRKITFAALPAVPSSTNSEMPCPAAIIDKSAVRPTSTR